jgi:hypothetical protein
MSDHPIQGVFDAIARSWSKAERAGRYPMREIDLMQAMREDEGIMAMACELKEARDILDEGRAHWLWRWLAVAQALALLSETVFLLTR